MNPVASRLTLYIAALFFLSACGGGGGSSTPSPAPTPVPLPVAEAPGIYLLAGTVGSEAGLDGTGRTARFYHGMRVVSDPAGNLTMLAPADYFSSGWGWAWTGQSLRSVTAQGKVSSVAVPDPFDGAVLARAPDGTLYGLCGGRICSLDQAGKVLKIFTGQVSPSDMAFDSKGRLYLMSGTGIQAMGPGGIFTDVAGDYLGLDPVRPRTDGKGAAAAFDGLADLTVAPDGSLFVVDYLSVRKVTADGTVSTLSTFSDAQHPKSVAVASDGSALVLVSDQSVPYMENIAPRSLLKVSQSGMVTTLASGLRMTDSVFVDGSGRILLLSAQIDVLSADGSISVLAGWQNDTITPVDGVGEKARLGWPQSIIKAPDGTLYTFDSSGALNLRRIGADGRVQSLSDDHSWWGVAGAAHPAISAVGGVAVDHKGNIFVSDRSYFWGLSMPTFVYGGAIVKIEPDGKFSTFAGVHDAQHPQSTSVDGVGEAARFCDPELLGMDGDDNLYIVDTFCPRTVYRKITPAGVVTTVTTPPAGILTDLDGYIYRAGDGFLDRVSANGLDAVHLAGSGMRATVPGALPGLLDPKSVVRTGPKSFAVISGSAVVKVVLP